MRLSRSTRTALLSIHITASVGWLVLVCAAVTMAPYFWVSVVTVGASLASGLLLSTGSAYGLTRYWWVLAKLAGSTAVVALASASLAGTLPAHAQLGARVVTAVVLLAMVALSVSKPRARTPWQRQARHAR